MIWFKYVYEREVTVELKKILLLPCVVEELINESKCYCDSVQILGSMHVLSCQPRVTVTSCFVYTVIWDLE